MKLQKPILAVILIIISGFLGCTSNEIGESKDVNQDKIFMDYTISYAEGSDDVSINFQYRFAGSAGTTLVLNNPSQVELDGEKLNVDSSKGGGAFYEVTKNYTSFLGKHSILFTDVNGKQFDNSFEFAAFALIDLPNKADRNKDLVISYNTVPLSPHDYIEINSIETDSSFHYHQSGPATIINIPATELKRQKSKEIQFESIVYREIPLKQTTAEGGTFKLTYRLKPVKIKLEP
jgi:hypothetical protein